MMSCSVSMLLSITILCGEPCTNPLVSLTCVHFVQALSEADGLLVCLVCLTKCRYHPDKNANDVKAADMFKEVTFSYNILSDLDKRRQYDTSGFEVCEPSVII